MECDRPGGAAKRRDRVLYPMERRNEVAQPLDSGSGQFGHDRPEFQKTECAKSVIRRDENETTARKVRAVVNRAKEKPLTSHLLLRRPGSSRYVASIFDVTEIGHDPSSLRACHDAVFEQTGKSDSDMILIALAAQSSPRLFHDNADAYARSSQRMKFRPAIRLSSRTVSDARSGPRSKSTR